MAERALHAELGGGGPPMPPPVLRLLTMQNDEQTNRDGFRPPEQVELEGKAPDAWRQWWRSTAQRMWPAWQGLERWETTALDEFEATLGEFILLLWSVHRFTENDAGAVLFEQIVDDEMHPTFRDPVLEDIVEVAFALGAAWAEDRGRHGEAPDTRPPAPHVLRPEPHS